MWGKSVGEKVTFYNTIVVEHLKFFLRFLSLYLFATDLSDLTTKFQFWRCLLFKGYSKTLLKILHSIRGARCTRPCWASAKAKRAGWRSSVPPTLAQTPTTNFSPPCSRLWSDAAAKRSASYWVLTNCCRTFCFWASAKRPVPSKPHVLCWTWTV